VNLNHLAILSQQSKENPASDAILIESLHLFLKVLTDSLLLNITQNWSSLLVLI
jgi:hypothetical protein